jgi:hypothetical protein
VRQAAALQAVVEGHPGRVLITGGAAFTSILRSIVDPVPTTSVADPGGVSPGS